MAFEMGFKADPFRHPDAACARNEWGKPKPDWFATNRHRSRPDEWVRAMEICWNECPIREACLEHALETDRQHDYGVWGGTTRQQRKDIRDGKIEAA